MESKKIKRVEVEMCNGGWHHLVKRVNKINKMNASTDVQFFSTIHDWVKTDLISGKMFAYIMTHYTIIYDENDMAE